MMLQSSTIRQRKAPPPGIYDPTGNILSKSVAGKTTTYTYDKANQLVSSKNADGKVTKYEYDAAGRMVKEGEKTFAYGWLDKVMQVAENGKTTQSYSYDISGQLATADYGDSKETFLWDGLALLSRNNLKYVNEPAVTGGNPILAGDKVLFDDMLGNTLGVKDGEKFSAIDRDAFGELKPGEKPNLAVNFFTGKPEIDGLGYSFLFRNYRADLGKWQTTDPLGYPNGWNNLAYVNNRVWQSMDPLGLCDWVSPDGFRRPVPFGEDNAEAHTPPGYTYEPCESVTYVDESWYKYFVVSSDWIIIDCSAPPLYLEYNRCPGDTGSGKLIYSVTYFCGETLDSHSGVLNLQSGITT